MKSEPSPGAARVRDLERRVDSVVYRLGLTASLLEARALVAHGHVRVNGRKVDVASQALRPGDVVTLDDAGQRLAAARRSGDGAAAPPRYLALDAQTWTGRLLRLPERDEVPLPVPVTDRLVVEYYA